MTIKNSTSSLVEQQRNKDQKSGLRPYLTPRLYQFGSILNTASGSSGVTEAGMSTNNPAKRP